MSIKISVLLKTPVISVEFSFSVYFTFSPTLSFLPSFLPVFAYLVAIQSLL